MRFPIRVFAAALIGAALAGAPGFARAEETTREQVQKLMPQLTSKDETVRKDAERRLFALGAPGRAELERLAWEEEAPRVATALRLLKSNEWSDRANARGLGTDLASVPVSERLKAVMDDLQRRMDELDAPFALAPLPFLWPDGMAVRAKSSGELVENDRRLTWAIAEDGSVTGTTREGKDAAEQKFEAKSLAELREKNPDVARRLEAVLPRSARTLSLSGAPSNGGAANGGTPFASQPVLGIDWTPLTPVLSEQLELKKGMVVETVVAASLAEKLGLMRRDVLLEVNGKAVNDSADVRGALADVKTGDKVTAVVLRGGKRKSLDTTK